MPIEFQGLSGKNGGSDSYSPPGSQEAVRSQWHMCHNPEQIDVRVMRPYVVAEPAGWKLAGPGFKPQLLPFPAV